MVEQMIGVDSHMELYTLVFAWHQYGRIWEVLTDCGLVFIPFFGILFKAFTETNTSQLPRSASMTSLKRLEFQLIIMFSVVMLAGQPLINIHTHELSLVKMCVAAGMEEGTVYEDKPTNYLDDKSLYKRTTLTVIKEAKVPVWWYAVMAFSSGTVYALKKSLPCVRDIREIHVKIDRTKITTPELRAEVAQFLKDCYYPSYSFAALTPYQRLKHSEWSVADERRMQSILVEAVLANDIQWIDSELFKRHGSTFFYFGRYASKPIRNFAAKQGQTIVGTPYARPSCLVWWGDVSDEHYEYSLKKRLQKELFVTAREMVDAYLDAYGYKTDPVADETVDLKRDRQKLIDEYVMKWVLNHVISINYQVQEGRNLYRSQNDLMEGGSGSRSSFGKAYNKAAGFFGALFEAMKQYAIVYMLHEAAYVALALLMMSVYLMLPIGLVFSGFSYQFVVIGAAAIFTLKLIAYLYHVAWWLDKQLYYAVKGPADGLVQQMFRFFADTPDSVGDTGVQLKINLVTMSLYFVLPVFAVAMMGWAGFKVLAGLESLYDKVGGTGSAAGQATGRGMDGVAGMAKVGAQKGLDKAAGLGVKKLRGKK